MIDKRGVSESWLDGLLKCWIEPGALRARRLSARRGGRGVLAHAAIAARGETSPLPYREEMEARRLETVGGFVGFGD